MDPDSFEAHRSLLFGLAYRMLGSAMDAEDMVQEAYMRYRATPPESIRTLKSFLTTIVHHLCLDYLKSAQTRREHYVGPWLPEPVLTSAGDALPFPLSPPVDRESISMAFLVVLERLSPLERAVFLLREVFDYPYLDIAQITGRTEAACRQLCSRAKKHLTAQRPRFPASPDAHTTMVHRFMDACLAGDMDGLIGVLAEDVTAWTDSGGKVAGAARRPIQGRTNVARSIIGNLAHAPTDTTIEGVEANGHVALLIRITGHIVGIIMLDVADERINAVRTIANPDKLANLTSSAAPGPVWRRSASTVPVTPAAGAPPIDRQRDARKECSP